MRRFRFFLLLLLPLLALSATALFAPRLRAQTAVGAPFKPALSVAERVGLRGENPQPVTQITLGQSIVALNGPWKFHIGDNPQWAQPGFDDSGWQDYTIDPTHSSMTAVEAVQTPQLAGWQQHGHPGYTGYAWYRIRLKTPQDAHSLALLMPQYVDDAYEVYIDGQKVGGFGGLDGRHVLYPQQAKLIPIPVTSLSSDQPTTLAIRVWNIRYEALPSQHNLNGGLRGVPLLGPSQLLRVFQQSVLAQTWKIFSPGWLLTALFGAVGIISLFLFVFSRSQREYLWAGISFIGIGVVIATESVAPLTDIPVQLAYLIRGITDLISYPALPLAAMYLLRVRKPLWRRANYGVWMVILAQILISLGLRFGTLPPTAAMDRVNRILFPAFLMAEALLLLAIAVDGLRTIGKKAWLPLTPGLLFACGLIVIVTKWDIPLSASISISDLFFMSVPVALLIVFLMRFTEQQRENIRLADDMKQAREVQQVLIPAELPQVPGLTIESEYRPAREVGGDFFQIIPHAADGSVLIVVGDVTGKGLQAGMLVALIVGAIRNQTDTNSDPLSMLQSLNRRLYGRGHAHATCLALRISADGAVTLANAGHLPPYLNGKELPMEGAMPLGIIDGAEFSVMRFQLAAGDALMLMSDGVAEAQNEDGQLFGFERIHELLQKPITAAEVATAAQNFGQQDDISVLRIVREAREAKISSAEPAMSVG